MSKPKHNLYLQHCADFRSWITATEDERQVMLEVASVDRTTTAAMHLTAAQARDIAACLIAAAHERELWEERQASALDTGRIDEPGLVFSEPSYGETGDAYLDDPR